MKKHSDGDFATMLKGFLFLSPEGGKVEELKL